MERVYHTWDKWECYPAGFYEDRPPDGMSGDEARAAYADFLRDLGGFRAAAMRVLDEWPNSAEHYLSNEKMNRIAWIGQAAMCIATKVPAAFRSGFARLAESEQEAANAVALDVLNAWLERRGEPRLTMEGAASKTAANLY